MTVKEYRTELGITQKDVAYMLGVSVRTVQGYDQGRIAPSRQVSMIMDLRRRLAAKDEMIKNIIGKV